MTRNSHVQSPENQSIWRSLNAQFRRATLRVITRTMTKGLKCGRVYQTALQDGETITIGRYAAAVDDDMKWSIYGYHNGACRTEHFENSHEAIGRFFDITNGRIK